MAKNNGKAVETLDSINQEEINLQAQLKAIQDRKAAVAKAEGDKLGELIKGFLPQVEKLTGKKVGFSELISLVKQTEKGTLGTLVDTSVNRGKRLTDDERTKLRDALLQREANLKMKLPAKQKSEIAAEFGVTAQTCDTYMPTKEQIAALPSPEAAPAAATTANA